VIKAIIFDFSGVVADYRWESTPRQLARLLRVPVPQVVRIVRKLGTRAQRGKHSINEIMHIYSKALGVPAAKIKQTQVKIIKSNTRLKKGIVQLARKLRKRGYRVPLLSNTGPLHAYVSRKMGWYAAFSPLVLSCEEKAMKPQRKIYTTLLRKIRLRPEACIFIDDHPGCLRGAEKLGIRTIRFKGVQQVMKELKKNGVRW
jgi:putative hydrolase of the HAD superfamily